MEVGWVRLEIWVGTRLSQSQQKSLEFIWSLIEGEDRKVGRKAEKCGDIGIHGKDFQEGTNDHQWSSRIRTEKGSVVFGNMHI